MANLGEQNNKDFTGEVLTSYPLDDAIDWIASNLEPEQVFPVTDLENWAELNGYTKEE